MSERESDAAGGERSGTPSGGEVAEPHTARATVPVVQSSTPASPPNDAPAEVEDHEPITDGGKDGANEEPASAAGNRLSSAGSPSAGSPAGIVNAPSARVAPVEGTPANAASLLPPSMNPTLPDFVVFRKNPDKDDFGFKALFESVTNPMTYHYGRAAFRVTAFVSFPMLTIAIHPNTMFRLRFPQMMVAAVVSASTHRGSLGEQLGVGTWAVRGITFQLISGVIADVISVEKHVGAWYGWLATGIFCTSLCTHSGQRRFFYIYFFLYTLMIRMIDLYFGVVETNSAAWFSADLYIGVGLGVAALLFPYPVMTCKLADKIIAKLFAGMGKMVMAMQMFVFAPDVHAAHLFFQDYSPFEKLEGGLAMLPALMWFVNWEPTEFIVRNPIRQLKLAFLRRILALSYTAFHCGRTIIRLRRDMDEQKAMRLIKISVSQQAGLPWSPGDDAVHESDETEQEESARQVQNAIDEEGMRTLKKNSLDVVKAFSATLTQCITLIGSTNSTPGSLLHKVPFEKLTEISTACHRANRMELIQILHLQRAQVIQHKAAENRKAQSQSRSRHSSPNTSRQHMRGDRANVAGAETIGNVDQDSPQEVSLDDKNFSSPFGHEARAPPHRREIKTFLTTDNEDDAVVSSYDPSWKYSFEGNERQLVVDYTSVLNDLEVTLLLQKIVFYMLIGMIAGEVESFGEMMEHYKPPKPLWRRLLDYFILEPWHDFWEAVWAQLTFATPTQVRTLKDAIKMTCAYLAAVSINLQIWLPANGIYFFSPTAILGLPVEEEVIGIAVCRMAGNTLGCALGYLCYHNTHNLSQKIGSALAFAFVLRSCQNHHVLGQCFFYGGVITIAGLVTSYSTMELLTRITGTIYGLSAYMIVCMVVFPTSPSKVLWNYRMKLMRMVSELMDDVVVTARAPLQFERQPYGADDSGTAQTIEQKIARLGYPLPNETDMMCSQLNMGMVLLRRMLVMCSKWTPFAATYPQVRSLSGFPTAASVRIDRCQTRLAAGLQLLVFGIQILHRPRIEPPHPIIKRMLAGPIAEFLENLAGAIRLLSQDFIDSLQKARTFSYPAYLTHVSYMARMRVRLRVIMYESYVFVNEYYSNSSVRMDAQAYATVRDEATRREHMDPDSHDGLVHVRIEDSGENSARVRDDPLSARGFSGVHGDASLRPADCADPMANVSFADRYLAQHRSFASVPPSVDGSSVPSQREEPGGAASGRPSRRAYRFHAPLQEETAVPNGALSVAPVDPEDTFAQTLKKEQKEARAMLEKYRAEREKELERLLAEGQISAASMQRVEEEEEEKVYPVQQPSQKPSMLERAMSTIMKPTAAPPSTLAVPRYEGPSFSYQEDDLETSADTDYRALVAVLSTCSSIMAELERMAAPVNEISGYIKEQHESSLILPLLDKISNAYEQRRKTIHAKYHYPPPPGKHTTFNSQGDQWESWRF